MSQDPLPPAVPRTEWLLGKWGDGLLIAHLLWPVWFLWQESEGFAGQDGLRFWQLYFVTTPHRWVTLLLVFGDRERLRRQPGWCWGILAAVVAVCGGVRWATGALTCLLAVDYVWNAWHFAAQHHGIYRIYQRRGTARSDSWWTPVEKWLLRGFLLYVIVRVAGATRHDLPVDGWLPRLDWLAGTIPGVLLAIAMIRRTSRAARLYFLSVSLLYLAMLVAVHNRHPRWVLSLTTASALFHAAEYLALVTWSVREKSSVSAANAGSQWSLWAAQWGVILAGLVGVSGCGGWWLDQVWPDGWLGINVGVAFLHYAYDGIIWRRRSP